MKTSIPSVLITFVLVSVALAQNTSAVNPPPDGGYPGGNTAEGQHALLDLTTGTYNTAVGLYSLLSNTTGRFNTGVGAGTLLTNTGEQNTAIGAGALLSNTNGANNTATGESALFFNTTGGNSTAVGVGALLNNTTGGNNTATGFEALRDNTTGNTNVAMGLQALEHNTTGAENTALGVEAGRDQTTGSGNVYIGRSMVGVAGETNKTYIRNINTTNVSGGVADSVTVDLGTGLLGHLTSSRRYKEDIQPMDQASETLYRLKPVTYRYKKEIDRTQSPAFGLIAEEVAEVNPDLIARDSAGRPETVRYEAVNAMLLNEFLKEHRKVEQLEKQIEKLSAGLRKVNARLAAASPSRGGLEMSRPAPQVAESNY